MKTYGEISIDRMVQAVEKVRDRLRRGTQLLNEAGIDYAVVRDSAVAAWISQVDESAVRFSQQIEILISRHDLAQTTAVLERSEFDCKNENNRINFRHRNSPGRRNSVQILHVEEVAADGSIQRPLLENLSKIGEMNIVSLDNLVRLELLKGRANNRLNVRDMIEIELIDETWPARFPALLNQRLQELLDDPHG